VWDADAAVHAMYDVGGAAVPEIARLCPNAVIDGRVDRDVLRAWVGKTPDAIDRLNAVIHPLVRRNRVDFLSENADAPIVVLDIPLLFETGGDKEVDAIVVVTAPPEVQRARVLDRGTMSVEQFETILNRQMPDADKRARADYIIETTTLDAARAAVHHVLTEIRKTL
jgi:dephospho-CoA kinase